MYEKFYTCWECGRECSHNDDLYWCTNKKCHLFKNSNQIEKEDNQIDLLEQEIAQLKSRTDKLERAINAAIQYKETVRAYYGKPSGDIWDAHEDLKIAIEKCEAET